MDYIVEEILAGELVPVLLGVSRESIETARRMFRQHRVISHVFCDKIPPFLRLSVCMKFHTVRHSANGRLMVTALQDFAEELNHADLIFYLIPCTERYANLIWRNRAELESRYVIANPAEMRRVWFGKTEEKNATGRRSTT